MLFSAPMPYAAAVARLESKTPVASALRTAEWSAMPLALRDRAIFSAGVESMKVIAALKNKVGEALSLTPEDTFMSRDKFIADMRGLLGAAPGDSGELTDLTSGKRLGLIYDHNVESAMEAGRWQAGQDSDILDAFPAQELVRVESREVERDWASRWADAGGQFYGGRMIARKDDPIWEKISRFGTPYPPFDFGSGMGLEDISRSEAEELGLLSPSDVIAPQEKDFNARLEATLPTADASVFEGFREIFGDQVTISADGKVKWRGRA